MPARIQVVDIKSDMPAAGQAVRRAHNALVAAKASGAAAVKLIHGYGSTGVGGRIRTEARRFLEDQRRRGKVRAVLPGEAFSIFDQATLRAFDLCPELRRDSDLGRENSGVTIVVL